MSPVIEKGKLINTDSSVITYKREKEITTECTSVTCGNYFQGYATSRTLFSQTTEKVHIEACLKILQA